MIKNPSAHNFKSNYRIAGELYLSLSKNDSPHIRRVDRIEYLANYLVNLYPCFSSLDFIARAGTKRVSVPEAIKNELPPETEKKIEEMMSSIETPPRSSPLAY